MDGLLAPKQTEGVWQLRRGHGGSTLHRQPGPLHSPHQPHWQRVTGRIHVVLSSHSKMTRTNTLLEVTAVTQDQTLNHICCIAWHNKKKSESLKCFFRVVSPYSACIRFHTVVAMVVVKTNRSWRTNFSNAFPHKACFKHGRAVRYSHSYHHVVFLLCSFSFQLLSRSSC